MVAVGRELVRHKLAIHPNADDIREVQHRDAFVILLGRWGSDVGIPLVVNLDHLARKLTPGQPIPSAGLPFAFSSPSMSV